jgi:DNA-binding response OmpR family regulator/DNA-binding CsgD family transcriptional regulator
VTSDGPKRSDVVLVVDDSPETLSFLKDTLEQTGATVLLALSGDAALSIIQHVTPDIILLDAVMAGIDGFETCRRLKQLSGLAEVPVIFMTGLSAAEDVIRGLEVGGVDYVAKPVAPEVLMARVRVHLANARTAQSARAALDRTGRHLLASDRDGRILWSTPQATKLLAGNVEGRAAEVRLPGQTVSWLATCEERGDQAGALGITSIEGELRLRLSFVSRTGDGEFLLRLTMDEMYEEGALRQHFDLTPREAEVLHWIARGKSNRDIGAILNLSPRTVNKHQEQIYRKLGVENRASATALALRTLNS